MLSFYSVIKSGLVTERPEQLVLCCDFVLFSELYRAVWVKLPSGPALFGGIWFCETSKYLLIAQQVNNIPSCGATDPIRETRAEVAPLTREYDSKLIHPRPTVL